VGEVEGERDEETNNDGDGNDKVDRTGRIEMFRQSSPGDGLGVERLYLLP